MEWAGEAINRWNVLDPEGLAQAAPVGTQYHGGQVACRAIGNHGIRGTIRHRRLFAADLRLALDFIEQAMPDQTGKGRYRPVGRGRRYG